MKVAPLRGLRFDLSAAGADDAADVTAPPYDVISPDEHRALLERSPCNIAHLTLGSEPGGASSYDERAAILERWIDSGVLARDGEPRFYVYTVDYTVPGTDQRARMLGFVGLGKLHAFEERVVLPHEQTFAKIVEDRRSLLAATGTHLESIFLLYSDVDGAIDALLEAAASGEPAVRVEAKPGEIHALIPVDDPQATADLAARMEAQRPIIADGHHRYTTSVLHARGLAERGEAVPGSDWQLMTFTNLQSPGLAILATHRLLELATGSAADVLGRLDGRLERTDGDDWDIVAETADTAVRYRFPEALLASRDGVARTGYAILQDVIVADWLRDLAGDEPRVSYYKEGTGENEALRRGDGDVLFRMRPVDRREFRDVIEGGEVYPHKTTYFYPKLWSGLVLWPVEAPTA